MAIISKRVGGSELALCSGEQLILMRGAFYPVIVNHRSSVADSCCLCSRDRLSRLLIRELFDDNVSRFNDSIPLDLVDSLFQCLNVVVCASEEGYFPDKNWGAHIDFGYDMVDHHARFFNFPLLPSRMGTFNGVL